MKKTKTWIAAAAALLLALPVTAPLHASATTVDDVIAAAYGAGWPDYLVQQAVNMYAGGNYTSDQCDKAIAQIYQYDDTVAKQIEQELGISIPSSGGSSGSSSGSETTTDAPSPETPAASDPGNASGNTSGSGSGTSSSGVISNVGSLGSSANEARPSDQEFIHMTLDEKREYLNAMPEADKQQFVSTMTASERNSIIKQLGASDKAEILASFTDVGKEFGITFNIDSVTEDQIVVSARDENGKLMDVAAVGITIDATGYSYTKPILLAGGLLLLSIGGIAGVVMASRRKSGDCN